MALSKQAKETLDVRLGSDLKFPIAGNFESAKGLDLLLQDIQRLILTMPGERVNRPEFGCALRTKIWGNIDDVATSGAGAIESALSLFEPRITVTSVVGFVNRTTDLVSFKVSFIVKSTDTAVNLIVPLRASNVISSA